MQVIDLASIPPYSRRRWLKTVPLLGGAALSRWWSEPIPVAPHRLGNGYWLANVPDTPAVHLTPPKRSPFDWPVAELSAASGGSVALRWQPRRVGAGTSARLRLTSATDGREPVALTARLTQSGRVLGVFDIRFCTYMQPYELVIRPSDLAAVLTEGITLTQTAGRNPFWFFRPAPNVPTAPIALLPHLLPTTAIQPAPTWADRLCSLDSVQSFGWMEGCVLDGLLSYQVRDNRAKAALLAHTDLFFGENRFVYDGLVNERVENRVYNVEFLLPFAALAQVQPDHPAIDRAIQFCRDHANAEGIVADGKGPNRPLKTEECYTVSYPLAVLARQRNEADLAHLALQTLLARVTRLARPDCIYQRTQEQETPTYPNWARGVAWYLLGLAKTLPLLPPSPARDTLVTEFRQKANWVRTCQQRDGLWSCFLHQPETGTDTSGSAGIAAALAVGLANGLLPTTARPSVVAARRGLGTYLTPDGFLTGTAQANKGGEALQRSGYRVIAPYTLGFLGMIHAVID